MGTPNQNPIYSLNPDVQWAPGLLTSGVVQKDGTNYTLPVWTSSGNGSFVQRIRFRSAGDCAATVARIWINNGGSSQTAVNNVFWDEITLSATTKSDTAALSTYEIPLNFGLPPNFKLITTLGTVVASGYYASVVGGQY